MQAHVVVVHNDPSLLDEMARALREAGFSVVTEKKAVNAVRHLDAGPVDALVTSIDFGRNTLNGIALARMARARRSNIAIVFTPNRDWGTVLGDYGAALAPPLEMSRLVEAVHNQLRVARAA